MKIINKTNTNSITLALNISDIDNYGLFRNKTLVAVIDKDKYHLAKSLLATIKTSGLDSGAKPWNGELYLLDVDFEKFSEEIDSWTSPEDAIEKYGDLASKEGAIHPEILAVGLSCLHFRYSFKNVSGNADSDEFLITELDEFFRDDINDDEAEPYEIRFLKSGLIKVPDDKLPENFEELTKNKKLLWATEYLNGLDDHTIIEGMRDIEGDVSMFNEITAEAVQKDSWFDIDLENQYASALWKAYSDPDASLSLYEWENQHMGNFIQKLGFNLEQLSMIANGSQIDSVDMLAVINRASDTLLDSMRTDYGTKLIEEIKRDNNAPLALKELIEDMSITKLSFEKAVNSEDYMPDHCVLMYLHGNEAISIETDDKSETWDEVNYEDLYHVPKKSLFHTLINNEEMMNREISSQEGEDIYNYLINLFNKNDNEYFRNYILERK